MPDDLEGATEDALNGGFAEAGPFKRIAGAGFEFLVMAGGPPERILVIGVGRGAGARMELCPVDVVERLRSRSVGLTGIGRGV